MPPDEMLPLAARVELPARLRQAAIAWEGGGQVASLSVAGLDHGAAEVVRIKPDDHLHASRGPELSAARRRQLRGLMTGAPQGRPLFLLDVASAAKGTDVVMVGQARPHVLMPLDVGLCRRGLQFGDRVQLTSPLGLLGSIAHPRDGVPRLWRHGDEPLMRLVAQNRGGIPPLDQAEVVQARPGRRDLQLAVQVGHMPPSPQAGDDHHEPAEVAEMMPVKGLFQGPKTLVKRQGHTSEAEHGAILRLPPARGRWVIPSTALEECLSCRCGQAPVRLPSRKVSQLE